ncbi:MAG: hypothetical protein KAI70_02585 [Candidatus Omnitrophica bacterium]|nr:hypothetical protein [Candidatus Omnitrophota bacterium]
MCDIREGFHDLTNCLNQICVFTSTTAEIIKMKKAKTQSDSSELNKLIEEEIEALEDSNESAVEAANQIKKLKKEVYKRLDISVEAE